MAKEMVITNWCDHCLRTEDTRSEAVTVQVIAVAGKPKEIALCQGCGDVQRTFTDWLTLVTEYGSKLDAEPLRPSAKAHAALVKKERPEKCPIPGCDASRVNIKGIRDHLYQVHQTSFRELGLSPDGVTPLRAKAAKPPAQPKEQLELGEPQPQPEGKYPCDVEGCTVKAKNPQGLGAHKKAAHGIAGTSKSTAAYREAV